MGSHSESYRLSPEHLIVIMDFFQSRFLHLSFGKSTTTANGSHVAKKGTFTAHYNLSVRPFVMCERADCTEKNHYPLRQPIHTALADQKPSNGRDADEPFGACCGVS